MLSEKARGGRVLFARQRAHLGVNRLHALHRQQLERQGDGEICLFRFEPARAQESREIRRRRIGRVELRHWRNDRKNAHFGHVRKYIACAALQDWVKIGSWSLASISPLFATYSSRKTHKRVTRS